jgi:hypothetical protein
MASDEPDQSSPNDSFSLQYSDTFNDIKSILENSNSSSSTMIDVINCPSSVGASRLIANQQFLSILVAQMPSVVVMRVMIWSQLRLHVIETPKLTNLETKSKFVISIESEKSGCKLIFWKNWINGAFLRLQLDDQLTDNFVYKFIINAVKNGDSGKFVIISFIHGAQLAYKRLL